MAQKNLKDNKKTTDNRARNWGFIAYPDSVPKDWKSILFMSCAKVAISPLHDSDLNADETQKKPHWHIVLIYEGKKSYNQIKAITDSINATIPQKIASVRGTLRYFCHLDNPEKAQYSTSEVVTIGLNYEKEILSDGDFKNRLRAEIFTMIRNENILEYADLIDRLDSSCDFEEHSKYACSHTILFRGYLQSAKHRNERDTPHN